MLGTTLKDVCLTVLGQSEEWKTILERNMCQFMVSVVLYIWLVDKKKENISLYSEVTKLFWILQLKIAHNGTIQVGIHQQSQFRSYLCIPNQSWFIKIIDDILSVALLNLACLSLINLVGKLLQHYNVTE